MAVQGQPRRPLWSFGSRRPSKPLVLCKSTRDKSQGRHFLEEDRAGGLGSWLTLLLPTTLQKGLRHTLLWVGQLQRRLRLWRRRCVRPGEKWTDPERLDLFPFLLLRPGSRATFLLVRHLRGLGV